MECLQRIHYLIQHIHVLDVVILVNSTLIRKLHAGMLDAWDNVLHLVIIHVLKVAMADALIINHKIKVIIEQEKEEDALLDVLLTV